MQMLFDLIYSFIVCLHVHLVVCLFFNSGITLTQVDEEEYALFAPNQSSYDMAITKINELLEDKNIFAVRELTHKKI